MPYIIAKGARVELDPVEYLRNTLCVTLDARCDCGEYLIEDAEAHHAAGAVECTACGTVFPVRED